MYQKKFVWNIRYFYFENERKEDIFVVLYFLLIYIVKLIYNNKYIFFSFIFEIKISYVSNKIFLIHHFQFLTNVPLKNLNKWILFQIWWYCNWLVRPPHLVIWNTGSIIYYAMNQKLIYRKSVPTLIIGPISNLPQINSVK